MQLSTSQIGEILSLLNEPQHVAAFAAIATSLSEERAKWVSMEDDEMYTEGNPLIRAHLDWARKLLGDARMASAATMVGPRIEPTDFYFYTGEQASERTHRTYWLDHQELPISALLIWQTVFTFSYAHRQWTARPFLGVTPRWGDRNPERPDDPLLSLAYSRKYDRERPEAALRRQTWLWERLCRARDLVKVTLTRVQRVEISRHWDAQWSWPEMADIHKQLEEDDLCLEICPLMFYGGTIEFEILELETRYDVHADPPKPPTKHAVGPAYARGSYSGPLTGQPVSAAASKKMIETALDELDGNLWSVLYPYSENEWWGLEEEVAAVRATLSDPVAK